MAAADLDARMRRRNQCTRDADVLLVADKMVGIVGAKRETEQCRNRPQRDVALFPRDAKTQHALAVMLTDADDAVIGNRRRIGAGVRIGQRKARDLDSLGEPRQIVVLLLVGAVVQQELRGAERVRHADRGCGCRVPRRDFREHHRAR